MKFNPEMQVVRFGSEDVIATSGTATRTITVANMGDGIGSNGTVNGQIIGTDIASQDFLSNFGATSNAGVNNGLNTMSFNSLFSHENSGTGVSSKRWNGTYSYDPDATWNNGTKNLKGVFTKQ